MNNTGNSDFDQINITAADLVGVDISSQFIGPGNFSVNFTSTDPSNGLGLQLTKGPQVIPGEDNTANLSLVHGHTSAAAPNTDKGNQSLYFYVDVPSSGLSAQKYNSTWNITMINLP